MIRLFTEELLKGNGATVGQAWRRVFPQYLAGDPLLAYNRNPATRLFHITGAYGVVLYGLPTQGIERVRTSPTVVQVSSAAPQTAALPAMAAPTETATDRAVIEEVLAQ